MVFFGPTSVALVVPATTLAGSGAPGSDDGAGLAASFNHPAGLALDSAGILSVADTLNQTIRRIAADGTVSTWVGVLGVSGASDGSGSAALFNQPMGLARALHSVTAIW